jgi:DNA-binding PucR family transcriptional regulator
LQETAAEEIETRLKGGFLDELLSGEFSAERIRRQGLALDYDVEERGRVLLVEPTSTEVSEHDMRSLYRDVVRTAQSYHMPHVAAVRGTRLLAVVADGTAGRADRGDSLEVGLEALLQGRTGEVAPNVVVGVDCEGPEGYRDSYEAAQRGLGLLAALDRQGVIFSFRSPRLEHLLLRSTEPDVLLDFVRRYVDPLREWDATHTSDLRHTLEVFYAADLNLQAAARRLHIHVSTLRYRLSRASEVLGVDLREGPSRLDVELALRASSVLGTD